MAVKKNIIWLPLELLDKRYTKLTRKWYRNEFEKEYNLIIIDGKNITYNIDSGSFLDSYGTNYYKFSQLMKVSKMFRDKKIKNGDIFFIDDLWFPGLEALRYMEKMGDNLNVRIYGVMHAGSWVESDDVSKKLGCSDWCKGFEKSIIDLCDKVFVGSNYHKKEIEIYFKSNFKNKIINTGLPYYKKEVIGKRIIKNWNEKMNNIIFPNRIHEEKHPELFDKLKHIINKKYKGWNFIKTMELNLTKDKYYDLLNNSKIVLSFSEQENFGYSIMEGITFGCSVVLPKRVVYPEFYSNCLYNTFNECVKIVEDIIKSEKEPKNINHNKKNIKKFKYSIKNMIGEMNE